MNEDQAVPAETEQVSVTAPAEQLETAVDEAVADKPTTPFWSVDVEWTPESTLEQRNTAFDESLKDLIKEVCNSPEEHLPSVVESIKIKRVRD